MSATTAPPGWHPDPSNPTGAFRWWDGVAWTTHTQQAPAAAPAAAPVPAPAQSYGNPYGTATAPSGTHYPAGFGGPANLSFAKQNSFSLIAIGVAAAYILIAMTAHIVLIGVIPIMVSIRAFKNRERLAPIALIAAILAVVFAFAALR